MVLTPTRLRTPEERARLIARIREKQRLLARRDKKPETPGELAGFIHDFFGFDIPRCSICADHDSPFRYISGKFFSNTGDSWTAEDRERWAPLDDVIVWACRGGLKTLLAGMLSHLDCKFTANNGVRILGGSLDQSEKAYRYFVKFCEAVSMGDVTSEPTKRVTRFRNGSQVEILTQSTKSVRGVHVPKVRCDEVEEFDDEVWRAVQFVTSSWKGIKSSFEALSTAHNPYGRMVDLIDHAEERKLRVLKWCLWEVIEGCPESRSCADCEQVIAHDENQRPHTFAEICGGKAKRVMELIRAGKESRFPAILIDDAHKIFRRSLFEQFEAEMLCRRPSMGGGRFYKEYDDRYPGGLHVVEDFYRPDWPLYEAYDGGYHHPRASVYQVNPATDQLIKIDEWTPENIGTSDFIEGLWSWKRERGYKAAEIQVCDPAASDLIAEFAKGVPSKGITGVQVEGAVNDRKAGQSEMRRRLRITDALGAPLFLVCQRCKVGRREMRELHYPKVTDGKAPAEDHVKVEDHGPDTDRYMAMRLANPGEEVQVWRL